ncbi:hypothetical protein EON63_21405 [archaeon]|nr:MAG: hypothetical protein EON63_21405 [archaeon]
MANPDDIKSWGSGGLFSNRNLGSLFLMLTTPVFCLTFCYICLHHDGSFTKFIQYVSANGGWKYLAEVWPSPFNPKVWKIIGTYMAFELTLMKIVPGKIFKATVTPTGHVPVYIANGFQCYILTIVAVVAGAHYGLFDPSEVSVPY